MSKVLLTQAGYWRLLQELQRLRRQVRPQVLQEVREAAAEGRLDRNERYNEARRRQYQLARQIKHLQEIISQAEVLVGSNLPPSQVRFNCKVKVRNLANGEVATYHLVSQEEADLSRGYLSVESPMGQALLGKKVGDQIVFYPPAGCRCYQILAIEAGGF